MAEAISGGNQRILLSVPTRSEPAAKQKKRPSRMTLRRERGLVSAYSPYASLKPILDLRYGRYSLPRIRFDSGCDACATEQSIIFISRNVRQASYAPRKHSKAGIVTGNFASKPPGRIVTFAPRKASVSYARSPIRALTGQLNQKRAAFFGAPGLRVASQPKRPHRQA